jgi:hypothetical protein
VRVRRSTGLVGSAIRDTPCALFETDLIGLICLTPY